MKRMRRLGIFSAVMVGIVCLCPMPSDGKLVPEILDQIIKESELIYVARPIRVEMCEYPAICSESMVVPDKPLRVFKGKEERRILLRQSNELHDQGIYDFSAHLLFLKRKPPGSSKAGKPEEGWLPTSYGRSYIKLESFHRSQLITDKSKESARFEKDFNIAGRTLGFPLRGPNSMITFPLGLAVQMRIAQTSHYPVTYETVEVILLPSLERYIRNRIAHGDK